MDFNNYKNFNSLSYCELNTKFNDRCHMDWSRTNLLSIVTPEGIYILQPHLERPHGPFKIELIRNPANKFRHLVNDSGEYSLVSFDNTLSTLSNKQYMELFLDPALSTNYGRAMAGGQHELTTLRKFRLAKWSPIIEKFPKECYLAVITVDYQLLIYGRVNGVWDIRADLSRNYDEMWSHLHSTLAQSNQPTDYESTRNILHALSFCDICWDDRSHSSIETSDNHLNLLATTLRGDVVIFQLIHRRQNTTAGVSDVILVEIKQILRTSQSNISCMRLHHGLLIASSKNGQVALYDINVFLERIESESCELNFNLSSHRPSNRRQSAKHTKQGLKAGKDAPLNPIDLHPTAILWTQDNIEVTDFYLQKMDKETSRIVLAKSTNICWCMIQYIERTSTNPATLIIGDSFSAIDGLDPEISLHQTPATWLKKASNKKSVLIADDGSFYLLDFFDDRQDVSPSFNAIQTGKLDLSDMIPRGVTVSPNGFMISMLASVTFMYDPAKLPAPTKLITLPTQNDSEFLSFCLQNLMDENWLQARRVNSPIDVCDMIDHVRSLFPIFTNKQCDKLSTLLKTNLSELTAPKTDIQIVKLKIIGFIQLKYRDYLESNSRSYEKDTRYLNQDLENSISSMILYHEIEIILRMLDSDPTATLTVDQMNSLQNFALWMDMNSNCIDDSRFRELKLSIRGRFMRCFETIKLRHKSISTKELCSICGTEIAFESPYHAQCRSEHRFVRCSRSLLTIDLGKSDVLECEHCKRHYIVDRLWLTPNLWPCLYCN